MASYFRVSSRIWHEPWAWDARILAVYILTSPHRVTEGLFRLPHDYIRADLGWTAKRIIKAEAELLAADFIRRCEQVILIVKALKYQAPQNPNQVTAALKALEGVPSTDLDRDFIRLASRHSNRLADALAQRFPSRFAYSPTPTPTPSLSSSSSGSIDQGPINGDGDDENLKLYLKNRGHEPEDIEVAMHRLRLRREGFGAPITDEAAWADHVAARLADARNVDFLRDETPIAEVDGERFEYVGGVWKVAS